MSDFDMIRALKQNDARLRQTEVKETVGHVGSYTTFYASGTFTPVFQGSGTAGTWAYSTQVGLYRRIADVCYFQLTLAASSRSVAPTGNALIAALPFTANATAQSHAPIALDNINGFTLTGTIVQLSARVIPGSTTIEFVENNGTAPITAANMTAANLGTTPVIRAAGFYIL